MYSAKYDVYCIDFFLKYFDRELWLKNIYIKEEEEQEDIWFIDLYTKWLEERLELVYSPDIIFRDWLASRHQLTNCKLTNGFLAWKLAGARSSVEQEHARRKALPQLLVTKMPTNLGERSFQSRLPSQSYGTVLQRTARNVI